MSRFLRAPALIGVCCTLSLVALAMPASTKDHDAWHFKYFAGDPPVWKDQPQAFSSKAECEISRAEKTSLGYPVGDCYALPKLATTKKTATSVPRPSTTGKVPNPDPITTKKTVSATAATAAQIEAKRQRKLAEGCHVACDADQRTCLSTLPDQASCIQAENTTCIERCTRVEQLPHHQCINEVCLPNEVNIATWQGLCESRADRIKDTCDKTHATCASACGS